MKELTIEQKAKAYNEIREKIAIRFGSNVADEIFSQFEMSEDEKIRKELIDFVKSRLAGFPQCEKFIAWLEKQGDTKKEYWRGYREGKQEILDKYAELEKQGNKQQGKTALEAAKKEKVDNQNCVKSTDTVELKFSIGDWIVHNKANFVFKVVSIGSNGYEVVNRENYKKTISFDNDVNYHLWTIQDAKDGDVLCYEDEISLYKHDIKNCTKQETTFGGFVYHCCYDGKRFIKDSLYSLTEQDKMDIHLATKEQRDLLFQKMKDAGYLFMTNPEITLQGNGNNIKYLHIDAFIEKVCDWLSDTLQTVVDVNIPSAHHVESIPALGIITQTEFIEKFKKEIIFLLD